MIVINKLEMFKSLVGSHLGYSDYKILNQKAINLFADATDDHQWIHTDPKRSSTGPFGSTIAHGYLTLSLIPTLLQGIIKVDHISMGINVGCNRVRFIAPVPVGSFIRAGARIAEVEYFPNAVQIIFDVTLELKGSSKPACVAQIVIRYYE